MAELTLCMQEVLRGRFPMGKKTFSYEYLQVIGSCVLFKKGKDKLKLVPNVVSFNNNLVKIIVVVRFLVIGSPNLDSILDYLCSIRWFWSFIVGTFLIFLRVPDTCQDFGRNYAVRFARITPLLQPIQNTINLRFEIESIQCIPLPGLLFETFHPFLH